MQTINADGLLRIEHSSDSSPTPVESDDDLYLKASFPGVHSTPDKADDIIRPGETIPYETPLSLAEIWNIDAESSPSPVETDDDLYLNDPFPGVHTTPDNTDDSIQPGETTPSKSPPRLAEILDIDRDDKLTKPTPCLIEPNWWEKMQGGSSPDEANDQQLASEDHNPVAREPYLPADEWENESDDAIPSNAQAQKEESENDSENEAAGFCLDLFLIPEANDAASGVYWEISLPTGAPMDQVIDDEAVGASLGVRIPAIFIKPSNQYEGMYYFDVVVAGFKPGALGRTRFGKWLGLNQNPIHFVQRIYCAYNDAWSYSRNMKVRGEPLILSTDLTPDRGFFRFPAVSIQMRSYDQTASILKARTQPPLLREEIPYGADVTDGDNPETAHPEQSLDQTVRNMLVAAILYYGLIMVDPETAFETIDNSQHHSETAYSRSFH